MDINAVENVISLLVSITGLLTCLFRYIEAPRRGWMYMSLFYLSCLMSDYFWTTYLLVMHVNPEYGSAIAEFGWNISCIFLYIIVFTIRNPKTKGFFHPLMFISIPVNIWLFINICEKGGYINSFIQCAAVSLVLFFTLRAIMYWYKNRKHGAHFPHLNTLISLYIVFQSGMWYFENSGWNGTSVDPYYYFVFASFLPLVLFTWGLRRDIAAEGLTIPEKSPYEMRRQILLQALVSLIIVGGSAGGYIIASSIKKTLPSGGDSGYTGTIISVTLFTISVFMVLLILSVITAVGFRSRKRSSDDKDPALEKRSRFNLVFTLLVTLILMTFTVAYNARLLFGASVERIYGAGQEQAASTATYIENYLIALESSLWTTGDTVELMIKQNVSRDFIRTFLEEQTVNRKSQFDKNFTGIYGLFRGDYIDGTGWVPPSDYDPTTRDWYKTAIENDGEISVASPYIDAETGRLIITVCKQINNDSVNDSKPRDVIALDVYLEHIQEAMNEQNTGGKEFGIIVDGKGLVISHRNPEYIGKNISEIYGENILRYVLETGNGKINATIDDEHCTLFISPVLDKWYVIIGIKDLDLFEDLQNQVLVNILISIGIFALISFFYYLSYKNEQVYSKKMEEMSIDRQKQEYEAEVLRLEKLAADEANKAKGSFLADMSHEIRTPINAILGMNEMILREEDDPAIREYAANIGTSGKNLLQLINSILDFSKIEDGKMEIVDVHYRLMDMITYLINSISERAKAKKLEFIVNADPGLPSGLLGDETRVNQVIVNLLTNAVKYTHEGSVTLTVNEVDRTDERVQLKVEVKDTGIGIKENEMDRLFESFERLDVVRNRNIEGTGLGMSITTKLLHLMDSELKVESVYGEGSAFSFEIWQGIVDDTPLGDINTVPAEENTFNIYQETFHAPDAHILIVDDTKMNIIVATGLLKKTGIRIDSASNGQDAISLTDETAYDLILLDQRMPGMDGTETLGCIRSSIKGKNKETPVICLTADAIAGAKERYIAEGFNNYLTKPINSRNLEEMLIRYLPSEKVHKTAEGAAAPEEEASEAEAHESGSSEPAAAEEGAAEILDQETALEAIGGDREFYNTILAEFARDYDDRHEKLVRLYEDKNYEEYKIYIHALKSSSKTVGAFTLSELAQGLEKASGEKDVDIIDKDHPKAMELYGSVVSVIKENVDIEKYSSGDDIIEFI